MINFKDILKKLSDELGKDKVKKTDTYALIYGLNLAKRILKQEEDSATTCNILCCALVSICLSTDIPKEDLLEATKKTFDRLEPLLSKKNS